jgi:hypothetical protein
MPHDKAGRYRQAAGIDDAAGISSARVSRSSTTVQGEQAKFFSRYVNCVTCDGSPPDR